MTPSPRPSVEHAKLKEAAEKSKAAHARKTVGEKLKGPIPAELIMMHGLCGSA